MANDMTEHHPIAVTMGEPAGIGPELIIDIWARRKELGLPPFYCLAIPGGLKPYIGNIPIEEISDTNQVQESFDQHLPVLYCDDEKSPAVPGKLNHSHAAGTVNAIETAVQHCRSGRARAVVTAPIHKEHLRQNGFKWPGHTELLAHLCDQAPGESVMMLATESLRVVPVTTHIALKDVSHTLTSDAIIHAGYTTARELKKRFGIAKPRLTVAALNPHAGEGGMMGLEEATHIQPAIWALQDMGIDVSGPLSADTLFHEEARTGYDAVLCMYHDQALIPLKTVDFWGGVNVTLGLGIIRTSPDHGTALSLAGQGKARPDSFINALRLADRMSRTHD